jgi:hypothetical protein
MTTYPDTRPIEERVAEDRTANGVPITPGLRVWTNDLELGTVLGPISHPNPYEAVWYDVDTGRGRPVMQDGSRMSTRHPVTGRQIEQGDRLPERGDVEGPGDYAVSPR